jgi:hypothetical protein
MFQGDTILIAATVCGHRAVAQCDQAMPPAGARPHRIVYAAARFAPP